MEKLEKDKVKEYLANYLKQWSFENNTLKRELKFRTFVEAFSFMTSVALHAEKMDHHPEWTNIYDKVSIVLNTHSVNGITQNDFDMAEFIESAYRRYSEI